MVDLALAVKNVQAAFLDTWTLGPSLADMYTDLGPVTRGGDSVDIPEDPGPTINATEAAGPAAVGSTRNQLIVNLPKFVNRALSVAEINQLQNGQRAQQVARSNAGYFRASIDSDLINGAIAGAAVTDHINLAAAALTTALIGQTEGKILSRRGVAEQDLFWLISPAIAGEIGGLYPIQPTTLAAAFDQGAPIARTLNGIPVFRHSGVPGYLRRTVAVISSSITSNVLTVVVAAGHGFVAGQLVRTRSLSANQPTGVVTSVTATTVVMALTSGDNATNGAGFLDSRSAQAMLFAKSRAFFASDQLVPTSDLLKRTDAAGYAHQMFMHIGFLTLAGAVKILHGALVNPED
jgi:hypothetical protein